MITDGDRYIPGNYLKSPARYPVKNGNARSVPCRWYEHRTQVPALRSLYRRYRDPVVQRHLRRCVRCRRMDVRDDRPGVNTSLRRLRIARETSVTAPK